jgi:hypothetical protein
MAAAAPVPNRNPAIEEGGRSTAAFFFVGEGVNWSRNFRACEAAHIPMRRAPSTPAQPAEAPMRPNEELSKAERRGSVSDHPIEPPGEYFLQPARTEAPLVLLYVAGLVLLAIAWSRIAPSPGIASVQPIAPKGVTELKTAVHGQ